MENNYERYIKPENFYLTIQKPWFNKNEILNVGGTRVKVLETPHKKWYKQLLQFISFGLYEAPTQYKVIQID
jgi:hypothetical protein